MEHRRIVGSDGHDDACVEHLGQWMALWRVDGVQRQIGSRAHITGNGVVDQHCHDRRVTHNANAMLDTHGFKVLDGKDDFGRSAMFSSVGNPRYAQRSGLGVDRRKVIGPPVVCRTAHANRHDMVEVVGEHLVHGSCTISSGKMGRVVGNETPRHAGGRRSPLAPVDDAVVNRGPFLVVLDYVAGRRHVVLQMDNTLGVCGLHITFRYQREVLGVAHQRKNGEVSLKEHGKAVELVPLIDGFDAGCWRLDPVAFRQHQQCGCIDRAFEMHMQLRLGHRSDQFDREVARHVAIVEPGLADWPVGSRSD